jgi:hypothetical protein
MIILPLLILFYFEREQETVRVKVKRLEALTKGHVARDGNNVGLRAPGLATSNVYIYLSLPYL